VLSAGVRSKKQDSWFAKQPEITGEDYEKLPDKQVITGDLFGIANLSWVL